MSRSTGSWLEARTGYRAGLRHLLDEPLPPGVNWWFTLGSVLLFLLALQFITGVVLTVYYAPTPDHAYDSLRFILAQVSLGRLLRGLHAFGASFIVVAAVAHMLRVFAFGAYKAPREMTWVAGSLLLAVILAFALTGYLLPWDQRAYWATVVTINIVRSTPLAGEWLAATARGGTEVGALTLTRWYAAHVVLLPAALAGLVVLHLYLMRRHGVAGPTVPREGEPRAFYPFHAIKDTIASAAVFAALVGMAAFVEAPLDAPADPTDARYLPRPEWYFLGLFQLLKYSPGPFEPVATVILPALLLIALVLLPFIDRAPERRPGARRAILGVGVAVVVVVAALTALGLRDLPPRRDPRAWTPRAVGGRLLAERANCASCHREGGSATALAELRLARDPDWIAAHAQDPETIAPGSRPPPRDALITPDRAKGVVSYLRRLQMGAAPAPRLSPEDELAVYVYAANCAQCHALDGEGEEVGPELSRVGREKNAEALRTWITDPAEIDPDADMPAFGEKLTAEELTAIVNYLVRRK